MTGDLAMRYTGVRATVAAAAPVEQQGWQCDIYVIITVRGRHRCRRRNNDEQRE